MQLAIVSLDWGIYLPGRIGISQIYILDNVKPTKQDTFCFLEHVPPPHQPKSTHRALGP